MPFGKFIHHRVDEKSVLRLKPEDLNAREIANTFAFPLAKSIFDILRQDGYKILRGFCDYLAEKLYLCTVKRKTTQVYDYTTREIEAAEAANQ